MASVVFDFAKDLISASLLLGGVPVESEEHEWANAIIHDPEDVTPRLVFADWLDDQGDPRGELIRIEQELANYWNGGPRPINFCDLVNARRKIRIKLDLMQDDPFPTVKIHDFDIMDRVPTGPYRDENDAERQLMRILCERGLDPSKPINCYYDASSRTHIFTN